MSALDNMGCVLLAGMLNLSSDELILKRRPCRPAPSGPMEIILERPIEVPQRTQPCKLRRLRAMKKNGSTRRPHAI